jgi:hypothetical protein
MKNEPAIQIAPGGSCAAKASAGADALGSVSDEYSLH